GTAARVPSGYTRGSKARNWLELTNGGTMVSAFPEPLSDSASNCDRLPWTMIDRPPGTTDASDTPRAELSSGCGPAPVPTGCSHRESPRRNTTVRPSCDQSISFAPPTRVIRVNSLEARFMTQTSFAAPPPSPMTTAIDRPSGENRG